MSSASLLGLRWTVLKLCKAENVRISLQSMLLELVLVSFKLLKDETTQSKMPESTLAKERKEERAKSETCEQRLPSFAKRVPLHSAVPASAVWHLTRPLIYCLSRCFSLHTLRLMLYVNCLTPLLTHFLSCLLVLLEFKR